MSLHRVLAFVLLVATIGCSRPSKDSTGLMESRGSPREEQRPLPTDPDVSVGTLTNGVKYIIKPFANTGHATRLVLVVGAGSLEEGEGERGFAHFVEHVAMDPAQRFGEVAPSELLARLGATLDADSNAETHFTHTQYFLTLQSADAALIAQGLEALAGWASGVTFTPEAVERQRHIVLAELQTSDTQEGGVAGRLSGFLMEGLGIAERGPLGAQADLQAAAAPRLEAFYRRWYSPQNLTIVAAGELDRKVVMEQLEKRFGALPPRPEASSPARSRSERRERPLIPGEKWIVGNAKEAGLPGGFATFILQLPAPGTPSEQDYQADLADRFLCALIEDRLRQPPPRGRFECTPVRPGAGQVQLRLRAWSSPGALRTSVEAMLVELQRALQHGFLEAELQRAQPRVEAQIAEEARRVGNLREVSQRLVKYAVGERAVLTRGQEQELGTRLLPTVNPTVLQGRARQWLEEGRRVLAAIREEGDDSLASEQALGELVREVRTRALPPPRAPALAIELMPVLPEPGQITHTERIQEPELHLWTLGNGATVVFKRGRRGSGGALLRGLTSGRTDDAAKADGKSPWSRRYASQIVQRSGAGAYDAQSLSRVLSTKTTKVHLGGDIDASSSVEDFETTLQLLHLYLTAPRRDPQAFEQLRAEMREQPAPERAFLDAMFPEMDRRAIAEQLKLDAALEAYRAQFGDVSGVELVIVADLPEDRVRALVERYLANLPGASVSVAERAASKSKINGPRRGSAPEPAAPRASAGFDGGIHRVRMANRASAESQVVMRFRGTALPSAPARVELEALEAYLRLRLREVLREQLGAIYDVDVESGWSGDAPWHEIRFDCKPADVEKLQRATRDVIAGIERPGISDAHLDVLRAEYASRFPRAFHEDSFWLEELVHAYREDAPPRRILDLPKLSSHITREALRLAARRHLPLDSYVDAVWSPGDPPSESR